MHVLGRLLFARIKRASLGTRKKWLTMNRVQKPLQKELELSLLAVYTIKRQKIVITLCFFHKKTERRVYAKIFRKASRSYSWTIMASRKRYHYTLKVVFLSEERKTSFSDYFEAVRCRSCVPFYLHQFYNLNFYAYAGDVYSPRLQMSHRYITIYPWMSCLKYSPG